VPTPTPTAKAPNADAASSANPAKPEAQPGSARLPVATVLSPNTALPSGAPLLRLIVVGDSGIGKSALLERFVHARFGAKGALATLSVDLSTANVSLGAQAVSVQLFDTAGQERFAPLIGPYYRHADGVLVAYDVGHRTSFERAITYWASEIAKNATPGTPVVLVGTKADRLCEPGYRRVETREAEEAASALGWPYCGETSAATGVSVGEAFYLLSCEVMNARFDAGRAADGGAPPIKVELGEHPKGAAGCAC
jgi:small GTP-binding protein